MHFFIPDHPSTIDESSRNQRSAGPSSSEGVYYAQAAPPRGWRATLATPTRGKAFARDQEVRVQERGTGRLLVAFVVRDTNAYDQTVLVTINGQQFPIPNDPAFIR